MAGVIGVSNEDRPDLCKTNHLEEQTDELVQLGLLWVAKEAVRKCLSETRIVGFRELKLTLAAEDHGYYLLQFQPNLEGIIITPANPLSVIAHHDDSYAIAVCTID